MSAEDRRSHRGAAGAGESPPARTGKDLIDATKPFTLEDRGRAVRAIVVSFGLLAAALAAAAAAPWEPARFAAATLAGLLVVRCFILYHDHLHGSLLRSSRAASAFFSLYGVLVAAPPRIWRETHNYHHAHTGKLVGSHVGSYVLVTADYWGELPLRARLYYRAARHPLTIALGYLTIFFLGMCVRPFFRGPRAYFDSGIAVAVHAGLTAALLLTAGPATYFFVMLWPLTVACALGAYLFYVQHNFPGVHILSRREWTYTGAALESSAFIHMSRPMHWFTGNIGYHHVHHLNPGIPFYRLPEAMSAVPELQHPLVVTLGLSDTLASFRLSLCDGRTGRLVGFDES